jgi:opacity protein-like surface antigen
VAIIFGLILSAGAVPGAGEEKDPDGSGTALTVFASSGSAVVINGSRSIDTRSVGLRWSRRWRAAGDGWLLGNPTLSVELIPVMTFDQEPEASAPALSLLYEHRFAPAGGLHPVLRAGAGILYASREVPPGETRLNFSLLVGIGLDIDVSRKLQLAPEYRFHHVSNANTGPINPGINAHTLVLGLTYKLR